MGVSSLTATLTASAVPPRHGKRVPHSTPEAMDVDRDGQHSSSGNLPPRTENMDTSWDGARKAPAQVKIPGLLLDDQEAPVQQQQQQQQQPPPPPVLERPREESKSGDTQEAQSQLASLPDPATTLQTTTTTSSSSQTIPPSQTTSTTHTVSSPPNTSTAPTASTSQTSSIPQMAVKPQDTPLTQNPLLTSNLISLYGLDGLASTVARTDPQTGEKINKMRKSYEGQLKTFGLSGRNKSVKHDPSRGMGLSEMATWPEEEWRNQKVFGKDIKDGMPESMKAKLEKAMAMLPGPVPENDKWEDLLGIEKVKPTDANKDKNAKNATASKSNEQQTNGVRPPTNASTNNTQVPEPIRARRTTKKRRYDDGSFEGYGEGYVDDEIEAGYTSGESRSTKNSAGNRKRRKTKEFGNNSTEYAGSRNNSFTAGPVGISASYGR